MKKNDIINVKIDETKYPGYGISTYENNTVLVKGAIPEQELKIRISKKRKDYIEGSILEIIKPSSLECTPLCPHFENCGGCTYQNIKDDIELELKSNQIYNLISPYLKSKNCYEGIIKSPITSNYRNKMEFTFGNETKGSVMNIGLHRKNCYFDIIDVSKCNISPVDTGTILTATSNFFNENNISFYHKITHEGILRNLVIRYSITYNELLLNLVTTSNIDSNLIKEWSNYILSLKTINKISGIIHTINDSMQDTVKEDYSTILYGKNYITDKICNLYFDITPFSFFQTNTLGAEVLYKKVLEYLGENYLNTILDLYSGTGTICQLVSSKAKEVIAVEIIEEAVQAAIKNSEKNNIKNITFVHDDVLNYISSIKNDKKIDAIILDPPRSGVNPKALNKIMELSPQKIIYISCKATSFINDYKIISDYGYSIEKCCSVNQFPKTSHTELIALLNKL